MKFIRRAYLALFLFISVFGQAQEKGIHFEMTGSLKELFARATNENKFVFMDCYTTWCGPCKFMDENIFNQDTVGEFYNQHFISIRYQIDTIKNDPEIIKNRYQDAAFVKSAYRVKRYPTFLYFNPHGELVHRAAGSSDSYTFIEKGQNSLDPETQYYAQLSKYNDGSRDPKFLKKITLLALMAVEDSATSVFSKAYVSAIGALRDSGDFKFVYETTNSVSDTGFVLMLNNLKAFEAQIGKDAVHDHLINMIISDEMSLSKNRFNIRHADEWKDFSNNLKIKYPFLSKEDLFIIQTDLLLRHNDLNGWANTIDDYIAKHAIPNYRLNSFAWTIFQFSSDPKLVVKALKWSKKTITDAKKIDPNYVDTYANLLYKSGKPKEAILWEKKAQSITIAQGGNKNFGQDIIDKINKGEITW